MATNLLNGSLHCGVEENNRNEKKIEKFGWNLGNSFSQQMVTRLKKKIGQEK